MTISCCTRISIDIDPRQHCCAVFGNHGDSGYTILRNSCTKSSESTTALIYFSKPFKNRNINVSYCCCIKSCWCRYSKHPVVNYFGTSSYWISNSVSDWSYIVRNKASDLASKPTCILQLQPNACMTIVFRTHCGW